VSQTVVAVDHEEVLGAGRGKEIIDRYYVNLL
jgi:hypothetical protein